MRFPVTGALRHGLFNPARGSRVPDAAATVSSRLPAWETYLNKQGRGATGRAKPHLHCVWRTSDKVAFLLLLLLLWAPRWRRVGHANSLKARRRVPAFTQESKKRTRITLDVHMTASKLICDV